MLPQRPVVNLHAIGVEQTASWKVPPETGQGLSTRHFLGRPRVSRLSPIRRALSSAVHAALATIQPQTAPGGFCPLNCIWYFRPGG